MTFALERGRDELEELGVVVYDQDVHVSTIANAERHGRASRVRNSLFVPCR